MHFGPGELGYPIPLIHHGIVSRGVVWERCARGGLDRSSGCQRRQADHGVIAERGDRFQHHVPGALSGPLVVLFQQQCADAFVQALLASRDAPRKAQTQNGLLGVGAHIRHAGLGMMRA